MKLLVLGYYYCDNLGDDLFLEALSLLLKNYNVIYSNIKNINNYDLEQYDAVILGGGDLLNDFFASIYEAPLLAYTGYKLALGVGTSYEECNTRKYITCFDDILIRNKTDLNILSNKIGSLHVNHCPDLVFALTSNINYLANGKTVGFFLIGSMYKNKTLMFDICTCINWLILLGYNIHLIPMGTSEHENDLLVNREIYEIFKHTNMLKNYDKLTTNQLQESLNYLDFAICARFHAHILCTKYHIPFISIIVTRKVKLYVHDLPESCQYYPTINYNSNNEILTFDQEKLKEKFLALIDNKEQIKKDLAYFATIQSNYYSKNKISNLLDNHRKRIINANRLHNINYNDIYHKYLTKLLELGVNPLTDELINYLSVNQIHDIANQMCYDLTLDTANVYSYGTCINLEKNSSKLQDIVKWIYYDYKNKLILPKVNLNYIKQDSFRDLHRAGWQYAIDGLMAYNDNYGVLLDTYLDRTFGWASNILYQDAIIPYNNFWVGFFHHTFEDEFAPLNNLTVVFNNPLFLQSLNYCKGIFVLSSYLLHLVKQKLQEYGYGYIMVEKLYHPTIFSAHKFDVKKFNDNNCKKLINIGSWYRNPVTIYTVTRDTNFTFCCLKGKRMDSNFCPTIINFSIENEKLIMNDNTWTKYFAKLINTRVKINHMDNEYIYTELQSLHNNKITSINTAGKLNIEIYIAEFISSITILQHLSNQEYDQLLVNNIVFLDLVSASAANTLIECIVRCTPLIIRRMLAAEEALGVDYPLFYDDISEINALLHLEKIIAAHTYMKEKIDRKVYRIENFIESFSSSNIYCSL